MADVDSLERADGARGGEVGRVPVCAVVLPDDLGVIWMAGKKKGGRQFLSKKDRGVANIRAQCCAAGCHLARVVAAAAAPVLAGETGEGARLRRPRVGALGRARCRRPRDIGRRRGMWTVVDGHPLPRKGGAK